MRPKGLFISTSLGVLILLCLLARQPAKMPTPDVPEVQLGDQAIVLDSWLTIGPFEAIQASPLQTDFLGKHGVAESQLSLDNIDAILASLPSRLQSPKQPFVSLVTQAEFLDFQKLFAGIYDSVENTIPSAAYVCCVIKSSHERDGYLLLGSDDGVKVWLNGETLISSTGGRALRMYNDAVRLPLRPGSNFLLIKVEDYGIYWGVTARVEPSVDAATKTALDGQRLLKNSDLLKSAIVSRSEPLQLAIAGGPKEASEIVAVSRLNGELVTQVGLGGQTPGWTPDDSLTPGLYQARIQKDGRIYTQRFCIGDPIPLLSDLVKAAQARSRETEDLRRNLSALETRVSVLTAPKNLMPHDREWQRKILFLISEYQEILARFDAGTPPFRNVSGLHLRGFTSQIDGQTQYYRVFVPEVPEKDLALPLIVMLPTLISTDRPFLESPFIAAQYEAERISAIAQSHKVAIVWSGYRNRPYGYPCEFTHLDEVLAAVEQDYKIDRERVTLAGACSGGWLGLMTSVRWPERFAGMSLLNPYLHRIKNAMKETGEYAEFPSYRNWIRQNDPFEAAFKEGNLPIHIIHDGAEPGHGPIEASLEFIAKAQETGYPASLKVLPQTEGQHFVAWDEVLGWLAKQKRENASNRRNEKYFHGPEGMRSISQALAEQFICVVGTNGSPAELEQQDALYTAFAESWKAEHKGPCRAVKDIELSEEEARNSNLVLFGNPRINLAWEKLSPGMKLKLHSDHVEVGGKTWRGRGLGVQATFTHPRYQDRRVVVIGAADLGAARFGTMNLSADGWFECAIWKPIGRSSLLLAAESFTPPTK